MSKIDGGLRKMFHEKMPWVDWQAVETGGTGRGIPDTNFCGPSDAGPVEGWCEMKLATAWSVDLRPEQVAWIHRRWRAGGRVWVAVRRKTTGGPRLGSPADELVLVQGGHIRALAQDGLKLDPALIAARWAGGPRAWPWQVVWATLAGTYAAPQTSQGDP